MPEAFTAQNGGSPMRRTGLGAAAVLLLCMHLRSGQAQQPPPGYGEQPKLPAPEESWLPTIKWSVANEPWKKGQTPKAAAGLQVVAFAQGLKHPRWLHVLPNGDVLVAEAASEPAKSWWPRTIVQNMVQRRSGSIVENANRISLLRDANGDGVAEQTVRLPRRIAPAVRNGADRRPALRRQHRQRRALSLPGRRHAHHRQGHQAARPARRPSLDAGPAGQPGRHEAVRYRRLGQQHRREGPRHREGPRDHPRARHRQRQARASSPPACATPTAWRSSRRPARCGPS